MCTRTHSPSLLPRAISSPGFHGIFQLNCKILGARRWLIGIKCYYLFIGIKFSRSLKWWLRKNTKCNRVTVIRSLQSFSVHAIGVSEEGVSTTSPRMFQYKWVPTMSGIKPCISWYHILWWACQSSLSCVSLCVSHVEIVALFSIYYPRLYIYVLTHISLLLLLSERDPEMPRRITVCLLARRWEKSKLRNAVGFCEPNSCRCTSQK